MLIDNSILKTKFFLPQPTSDFIERKGLKVKFDELKEKPVMLVSASTGYGKSTVVSAFLKNREEDHVWLSLSEKENEFQRFVLYFIKAIQGKVPGFGEHALELVYAPEPPAVEELAEHIVNDLAELDKHVFMAVDDYHLIRNNDAHLFVTKLFQYPQPFFRLIIVTRRDPELPFSLWRGKNILIEVRTSDLKFNRNEIAAFYEQAVAHCPEDNVLSKIVEATEGWISGLRILMLTANNREDLQNHISNFNYKNSRVIHELIDAVLDNQSDIVKDRLLRLSILNQFNVDLFSELCLNEEEKENKEIRFNEFTLDLINSNMFIIALDDKHSWYRFHHLFTEQLYELLLTKYDNKKVGELRLKAADWHHENNIPEDAIKYYLQANQVTQALDIFMEYRLKLISETRFQQLELIFNMFPDKIVEKNGILLVTKGWLLLQKGNIPEMARFIKPLEQFLLREGHPQEILDLLIGELHAMKTFDRYLSDVDMQACLKHCKQAIKLLRGRNPYACGMAWVYYGAVMQHLGQPSKAKKEIYEVLENNDNAVMKGHLLLILCFIDWFEGNLGSMIKTAEHLLRLGHNSGIKMVTANGNILTGIAYYYQNNDEKALDYLLESHELRRYTYLHMSFATGMALADIYAKTGKIEERDAIIQAYETTALNQGGKLFNKITKSASAELAWRDQNNLSGLKWAKENDYKDFLPLANLFSPEIVQARILALDDDPSSNSLAQEILNTTIPFFEGQNDINVLIRAFTIQVVLYFKAGELKKAYNILEKVVKLSSVGQLIRPYLQLGKSMNSLLIEYKKTAIINPHIDEILQYFQKESNIPMEKVILTQREKAILVLAEKMTNKEVGNQLFISEKTVKVHITNINRKLDVVNRFDAIAKAKELALI